MVQSELKTTLDREPATVASNPIRTTQSILDKNEALGLDKPAHSTSTQPGPATKPPAYFEEALQDAELLLKYAAEIGIETDYGTRNDILQARRAYDTGWNEETAAKLLSALAKLAARLRPVTVESLKACTDKPGTETVKNTLHTYIKVAVGLVSCPSHRISDNSAGGI
jgi:hypothetical protein